MHMCHHCRKPSATPFCSVRCEQTYDLLVTLLDEEDPTSSSAASLNRIWEMPAHGGGAR